MSEIVKPKPETKEQKKVPIIAPEEKDDKSPSVDNEYGSSEELVGKQKEGPNDGDDIENETTETESKTTEEEKVEPSDEDEGNEAEIENKPPLESDRILHGAEGSCYICHVISKNFFLFGHCGHRLCVLHTIKYFSGETKPSTCVCGKSFIVTNEVKHAPLHTGTDREATRAWEKYIDYIVKEHEEKGNVEGARVSVKGTGIREKVISGVSKFIGKMDAETKEIEVSDIPIKEENLPILIAKGISAKKMREIGRIGIGTLILNNVTLSRLLEHDYGIDSLKDFGLKNWDQLQKLGITSLHLRFYKTNLLPLDKLKEWAGMTKQNLMDLTDNIVELASTGITSEELLLFDFDITDFKTLGIKTNHFHHFGYSFPEWEKFGFTLEILDKEFRLENINAFTACGPWIANNEVKYYYSKKMGIIRDPRYGRLERKEVKGRAIDKRNRRTPISMDYRRYPRSKSIIPKTYRGRKEMSKPNSTPKREVRRERKKVNIVL